MMSLAAEPRIPTQRCRPPPAEDWQTTWCIRLADTHGQFRLLCFDFDAKDGEDAAELPMSVSQADTPRRLWDRRAEPVEARVGVRMELTIGFPDHHANVIARTNAPGQLPRCIQGKRHAVRVGARNEVVSVQIGYYQRNTFLGMWVQQRPGSLPALYQIGHTPDLSPNFSRCEAVRLRPVACDGPSLLIGSDRQLLASSARPSGCRNAK
mgnify:CR=1 FL=1